MLRLSSITYKVLLTSAGPGNKRNRAVLCSHFYFFLLAYNQTLEKNASISQMCRDTDALKITIMASSFSVFSPCSETTGPSWVHMHTLQCLGRAEYLSWGPQMPTASGERKDIRAF